ncbi:hypothetical protein KBC04_05720, partial [Candidatus Babeliales bacterium]|nr:hypothetical protein [Candidatus Babeliales bacterium]
KLSINRTIQLLLYTIILMSSIFSFAKNNGSSCQQVEDVIDNGQRYMQFVFTDNQGNYTAGYLESYDDPSKGSLFLCIDPLPLQNKSKLHMQQLQQFHTASIARMKQEAILRSSVTQRQQVDQLYLQGSITAEQAMGYYQHIEHAPLIVQAQKKAKEIRKKYKNKKTSSDQKKTQDGERKSKIASQEIERLSQSNNLITRNCNKEDSSFQKVMNDRAKAFESSLKNQTSTSKKFKINRQTAGFLQDQNIDATQFQQVEGLPIQHQLTQELVDVLDVVADYAEQHHYEIYQTHLTKYCAHLASLTQQSNFEGALQQTIEGTNCCHGISHYLQGMVSGVTQAYHQFQTALDYFDTVADTYGNLILQHVAQGAAIAHGLEGVITAGIIAAPTVTVVATGIMIGATAYVMVPLCFQGLLDLKHFGGACMRGNWDKVGKDLDDLGTFLSSPETVGKIAELVGGGMVPTPNLNNLVGQILSLRPVITSVQNASGEMVESLYLMTKNQIQKVYTQGVELLQLPEFINFNMMYEKILGCHFFDILPKSHPALVFAIEGIEGNLIHVGEQVSLVNLFAQSDSSMFGDAIKSSMSQMVSIERINGSLRKRVSDLVRRGIGLENLSYDEIGLIARTIKIERNIDLNRSGDLSKSNVKFTDNSEHMFDDREGHRADSPEFRAEIMTTVKNVKNYHGSDIHGNDWYSEILSDGTQRWASVYKEVIKNCGVNETLQIYNPMTGLSKLTYMKK